MYSVLSIILFKPAWHNSDNLINEPVITYSGCNCVGSINDHVLQFIDLQCLKHYYRLTLDYAPSNIFMKLIDTLIGF